MVSLRDIGNAVTHRITMWMLRLRLICQRKLNLVTRYQPDPFEEARSLDTSLRSCYDRYMALSRFMPVEGPLSVIDVGCNDGFFVFKMAKRGGLCIGLDKDRNAIMVAVSRAALHGVPQALFSSVTLCSTNVQGLPDVDVIICLSVFHHWAHRLGEKEARELMKGLAAHAKRYLVFETGGAEEEETAWSSSLAFMGGDTRLWAREFLVSLGFKMVHEAGQFYSHVSSHPRTLFVAERT